MVQACACDTGGMGIQVCRVDSNFSACSCSGATRPPSDAGKGKGTAGGSPGKDGGPGKDKDAGTAAVPDAGGRRDAGQPDGGNPMHPGCVAGMQRCNANSAEICTQLGVFMLVRNCGAQVCSVAAGTASCHEQCTPGQATCVGATLRVCRADGQTFMSTTCNTQSGLYCDAQGATCATGCVPGSAKCDGAQSLVCKSDATGFAPQPACMDPTPACSRMTGRCSIPCAEGTVAQTFQNGMVGCTRQVAHDAMLAQRCSLGFHVCTAAEWAANFGGAAPTSDYWVADFIFDYEISNSGSGSGNCRIGSGTGGQTAAQIFRICTNDVGSCTALSGCGYQSAHDEFFGYSTSDQQAGALCCPD
jgi:hypothetical protein